MSHHNHHERRHTRRRVCLQRSSLVCPANSAAPPPTRNWIFSPPRKVPPPMTETPPENLRQLVEQTWRTHIGLPEDWSQTQKANFVADEALRISDLIETQMQGQGPLVRQWWDEHGEAPDYLTTVTLIETARRSITEAVLAQELYEQIPHSEQDFPEPVSVEEFQEREALQEQVRLQDAAGDRDRWIDPLRRRDPSSEASELSRQLWPDRSALFRVTGAFLLQARTEDGEPVPTGPSDPLAASFTNQVSQALVAAGRPLDGPGRLVDP